MGLGVVAGLLAAEIPGTDVYNGVALGILVYLISYYFARYRWYKGLGQQFQGKLYTMGLAVYIGLFIFTWILFFTQASV